MLQYLYIMLDSKCFRRKHILLGKKNSHTLSSDKKLSIDVVSDFPVPVTLTAMAVLPVMPVLKATLAETVESMSCYGKN